MSLTFTTTTKWALRKLPGNNLVADVDAGIIALADDVDAKLTPHTSGLLSARPTSTVVTAGKEGRTYRPTDGAGIDLDTGTSWLRLAPLPPLVTTLPTTGLVDAQEIYYLADATNGIIWHLRYRAASASAYKWEYLGGPPLYAGNNSSTSLTVISTWTDVPVSMTLPLTGDYDVDYGGDINHSATAQGVLIQPVATNLGPPAPIAYAQPTQSVSGGGGAQSTTWTRYRAQAISGTLKIQYFVGQSGGQVNRPRLAATPIRVG